jgi:hypothetical protein
MVVKKSEDDGSGFELFLHLLADLSEPGVEVCQVMDGGTRQGNPDGLGFEQLAGFLQGAGEALGDGIEQVATVGEGAGLEGGEDFRVGADGGLGRVSELAGPGERGALLVGETTP